MGFSFNAKEKREFVPLTEEDIRSRLYGSAVGVSVDAFDKPQRDKKSSNKKTPLPLKGSGDDLPKIHDELAILRSELEQAKRRLKKIKGINTKRLQIIFMYIIIFFAILLSLIFILRNASFFMPKARSADVAAATSKSLYTVQVAVSERLAEAEKFKANLKAKGYKPFIRKSNFASGKDRFTIYAGEFNDKESANALMNNLRSKEGIQDSFVVNMPK